jgi:hypothetical protein
MLQNDPLRLPPVFTLMRIWTPNPAFHFDADPCPTFQSDADPDSAFQNDADSDHNTPVTSGTVAIYIATRNVIGIWRQLDND